MSNIHHKLVSGIIELLTKHPNEWELGPSTIYDRIIHTKSGLTIVLTDWGITETFVEKPNIIKFNMFERIRLYFYARRVHRHITKDKPATKILRLVEDHIGDNKFITDL